MNFNIHKDKKRCSKCLENFYLKEYYIAPNSLIHADGRISICKVCLNDVVDFDDKNSVINTLRMIDRPFIYENYMNTVSELNEEESGIDARFGRYMRRISMPHSADMTYRDSTFTSDGQTQESIERIGEVKLLEVTDEDMESLIEFWGRGFSPEEYEFLQIEYEQYLNSYEVDSRALEIIFQEAAHQRLVIKNKREQNVPVNADLKVLQDLLGSANVRPNQETGANATEHATFGTLLKQYEDERPVPEPDEEWKDVDGIAKFFRVWFVGHLTRMLGLKNDDVDEYNEEIGRYGISTRLEDEDDD